MRIREDLDGKKLTLALEGNFDDASSPAVEKRFEQALLMDVTDIHFDMGKVQYISSAGIRVIIIAHKKALKSDKRVLIGQMTDKTRQILDKVGLLSLFSVSGR